MGHEIEVFTSGCYLCTEALAIVNRTKCNEYTVTEYNIKEKRESEVCLQKAREYGVGLHSEWKRICEHLYIKIALQRSIRWLVLKPGL